MSSDVKNDRAALGVHRTLDGAMRDAAVIKASKVRVVTLVADFGKLDTPCETVGYLLVPTDHKCPCCQQFVDDLE